MFSCLCEQSPSASQSTFGAEMATRLEMSLSLTQPHIIRYCTPASLQGMQINLCSLLFFLPVCHLQGHPQQHPSPRPDLRRQQGWGCVCPQHHTLLGTSPSVCPPLRKAPPGYPTKGTALAYCLQQEHMLSVFIPARALMGCKP